ncbi:Bug family tripartite tricarboxylate transporter substrate binding protein [Aquincola tertiaricarbonis]|uniref:Bug family tripartite tricarboxylate transporter substrate binding protein n=1 Tax=Aquincola tertiaricarbonis TaxID=391953 RepID=UPI0009FB79AB|nr:tripartite tricarboxylate transporter substrate-binding protein [Aquincola tertiaricarbonis]
MKMLMNRRQVLSGAAAGAASTVLPAAGAWANGTYPDRAIKLVVPWATGGSTDVLARAVGQNLNDLLGKPVVIDNRPGASGRLGIDAMVKSPADGYTTAVIELAHAIAPSIFQRMSYDIMNDTAAVSMLGDSPLILFVDAQKYKPGQYQRFLDDAKKSTPTFAIATSGNGSISHLAAGLFAKETGVEFQMIPYKGSAPALTDVAGGLLAGHICTLASASSLLAGGKIVPLMVTGNKRVPQLPNVPCATELKLTRMDFGQWWALVTPARIPKPVLETLYKATAASVNDKRVKDRISNLAINLGSRSPDETLAFVRAEATKWSRVVADLGIKPE